MSSNDYLNRLLRTIQDTYPDMVETPVLSRILPGVLLALVAQKTNIVITTPAIVDIQKSTTKLLSTVFGLQTKRVRIRSLKSPHDLLMSLFVPASPPSSASSHKRRPSTLSRTHSAPRPPSSHFTEGSDSTFPHPLASSRLPQRKTDPDLPGQSDIRVSLHLPQVVVISGLERAGRGAQLALADVLRTRRIILEPDDQNGLSWNLPDGFFVIFISSLGDGRERPAIHTALLDHFAFSVTLNSNPVPIVTPSSSPRLRPLPLSPAPKKPPLLPLDQIPHPDTSVMAPLVSHYITALFTAARHHPELDGTFLTARCARDVETIVRASSVVFREGEEHAMISELHVRRVVPPVLAHRLRVRDGPREQILGALWKEAGVHKWGISTEDVRHSRRTVKEILAEILAEV